MIKSVNSTLTIDGAQGQILMDFAIIYSELINIAPEIVAATVLHFGDKLEDADMLKSHDHICVARTNDLPEMDFITFRQALRYSIILEAGINAEL